MSPIPIPRNRRLRSRLSGTARPAGAGLARPAPARGFAPYQPPTSPPPGTYDPALDAELRRSQRGFGDLERDSERDQQRDDSGYTIGREGVQRGTDRSLADILRDRARGEEDHTQRVGAIRRGYERLGTGQAERATAAGVTEGGTLAASLRARQGNEALDRAPVDQAAQRYGEDSRTAEDRVRKDSDLALAELAKLFQYGTDDRTTALDRAGAELGFFEQDTGAQRFFQAAQSGQYLLPGRGEGGQPSNEFSDDRGPFRLVKRDGRRFRVRPDGSEEDAGPVRKRRKKKKG